ncbi:hypothetical protein Agub_g11716, partial [Astrephomene gubernaculifera]
MADDDDADFCDYDLDFIDSLVKKHQGSTGVQPAVQTAAISGRNGQPAQEVSGRGQPGAFRGQEVADTSQPATGDCGNRGDPNWGNHGQNSLAQPINRQGAQQHQNEWQGRASGIGPPTYPGAPNNAQPGAVSTAGLAHKGGDVGCRPRCVPPAQQSATMRPLQQLQFNVTVRVDPAQRPSAPQLHHGAGSGIQDGTVTYQAGGAAGPPAQAQHPQQLPYRQPPQLPHQRQLTPACRQGHVQNPAADGSVAEVELRTHPPQPPHSHPQQQPEARQQPQAQ